MQSQFSCFTLLTLMKTGSPLYLLLLSRAESCFFKICKRREKEFRLKYFRAAWKIYRNDSHESNGTCVSKPFQNSQISDFCCCGGINDGPINEGN